MSKKQAFKGRIVNGVIHYFKPQEREKFITDMEGKEIVERLEEISEEVSDKQRAYYFATNRWLIKETESFGGWSEYEVDGFARSMFLTTTNVRHTGNREVEYKVIRSLKDTSKEEMSHFIQEWLGWLSFNEGIYPPSAEEALLSKHHK